MGCYMVGVVLCGGGGGGGGVVVVGRGKGVQPRES